MKVEEKIVAFCTTGNTSGEMSFLSGNPASATVVKREATTCTWWDHDSMKKMLENEEEMAKALQCIFTHALINKVTKSTSSASVSK